MFCVLSCEPQSVVRNGELDQDSCSPSLHNYVKKVRKKSQVEVIETFSNFPDAAIFNSSNIEYTKLTLVFLDGDSVYKDDHLVDDRFYT